MKKNPDDTVILSRMLKKIRAIDTPSIIEGTDLMIPYKHPRKEKLFADHLKGDRYVMSTTKDESMNRAVKRHLGWKKWIPFARAVVRRRETRRPDNNWDWADRQIPKFKGRPVEELQASLNKEASGIKQRMIDEAKKGGTVPMDNASQSRIIKHDGKIVGLHTPSRNAKGHPAMGFIYIRDKYRKQGHGSRFAADFKKKHPNMVYYTWDWNKPSVATAEKIGLKRIDTRKMSKGNLFIYGDPKHHKDVKDWGKDDIKYTPINKEK